MPRPLCCPQSSSRDLDPFQCFHIPCPTALFAGDGRISSSEVIDGFRYALAARRDGGGGGEPGERYKAAHAGAGAAALTPGDYMGKRPMQRSSEIGAVLLLLVLAAAAARADCVLLAPAEWRGHVSEQVQFALVEVQAEGTVRVELCLSLSDESSEPRDLYLLLPLQAR